MSDEQPECKNCDSSGWVCEDHADVPWNYGDPECCGGAGAPCPVCNDCSDGKTPRMMPGLRIMCDGRGWIN